MKIVRRFGRFIVSLKSARRFGSHRFRAKFSKFCLLSIRTKRQKKFPLSKYLCKPEKDVLPNANGKFTERKLLAALFLKNGAAKKFYLSFLYVNTIAPKESKISKTDALFTRTFIFPDFVFLFCVQLLAPIAKGVPSVPSVEMTSTKAMRISFKIAAFTIRTPNYMGRKAKYP